VGGERAALKPGRGLDVAVLLLPGEEFAVAAQREAADDPEAGR
jgi:hypothetical protein